MSEKKTIQVKVKVTGLDDAKLGASAAKEIKGIDIKTGQEWSKKFFSNQKSLKDQFNEIGIGDTVICTLQLDGKFWNLSNIEETDAEEPAVKTTVVDNKQSGSGGVRRSDGGSRGDDTNRSASIYLAQEIVAMQQPDWDPEELAAYIVSIADKYVYPYISKGEIVVFEKAKKGKKADPLSPPIVD